MVVFDNTFLSLLLHPDSKPPLDPATRKPLADAKERIEFLVSELTKTGEKILIPTPVLSEFLVIAKAAGPEYLAILNYQTVFQIVDFDQLSAIELAAIMIAAGRGGDKRAGSQSNWAKVKFDQQIVAIAKAHRADTIYSDDDDIERFGESAGLKVKGVVDINKPPESQPNLEFSGDDAHGEEETTKE